MSREVLLITNRTDIRNALCKTERDVLQDIQVIKNWLVTQKHLPEIPTDNMIEFFLTNCKYSIEKCKQNLDMYYTVRALIPEFYQDVNPCLPSIQAAYDTGYYVPLPRLTPTLQRISFVKYKPVDYEKADVRRLFTYALNNLYEIRIQEDLAVGEIYIIDCENLKMKVAVGITPTLLKQTAFIFEKVQSYRVSAIYFYKAPAFFHKTINLAKTIMNKKLAERMYSIQTLEELQTYVPLDLLPSDYGGNEKSLEEMTELWKRKLLEYKDRFDKLDQMKVNEELRPEKLDNDELLGYYGSFKKINTD